MSKNSLSSSPITISVPEAGKKYFRTMPKRRLMTPRRRGEIPTIKIGRLLRVSHPRP